MQRNFKPLRIVIKKKGGAVKVGMSPETLLVCESRRRSASDVKKIKDILN